jgi:peptidoglycan/LPS O-acetylase OafA/YrhL
MIPYIAFSVVSYAAIFLALKMPIIGSILFRSGYRVGSLADVAVSVLTYKNHIDQHLWYLYVLFLLLAFCYLTGRIFRGSIGIVLALVVYYIPEFIQTPDLLAKFCHSLIFFVIGRLAATISGRKRKPLWLAAFSVLWLGAFASRELILRDESFVFLERSLWLIAGVAGVSAVVLLASLIARTAAEAPLNFIGGYSMDIYILHQPFITSAISTVLVNMTHISYPVICAVATVSGLSLPVLLGKYLIRENGLLRLLLLGGRAKAGKPK